MIIICFQSNRLIEYTTIRCIFVFLNLIEKKFNIWLLEIRHQKKVTKLNKEKQNDQHIIRMNIRNGKIINRSEFSENQSSII